MALVSGRGSSLNPNARPFIPAVYRQVEDFSSEWWNLVQNSAWFRDYWMNERQEASFEEPSDSKDDDITNLLPETFDFGYDDLSYADAEYEEFLGSMEYQNASNFRAEIKPLNGLGLDTGALMKNINYSSLSPKERGTNYLMEQPRYIERTVQPVQRMNLNHGHRRIHQPR